MRAFPRNTIVLALPLLLASAAGSLVAQETVRLASSPSLSPDGSRLAFSWRGDIWIVPSRGGLARPLTLDPARDTSPVFSPDGKSIAFNSDRNGAQHAYVMPAAGGTPRQLTFHSEGCTVEAWYPDGRSLLVNAGRDHFWKHEQRFFRISAEKSSAEELLFDDYGRSGVLSPDGKRLLFTREGTAWWRKGYRGSQVWLYEIDAPKFRKRAGHPAEARYPLWAPDGKGFYYVAGEDNASNLWYQQLQGGRKTQLTSFQDDSVVMPCIAANGKTLVFRHLFDLYRLETGAGQAPVRLDIRVRADVAADSVQRRRLDKADDVAFSDDGLEVAMISGGDLWVMDTELREPRQVTSTPEEERDPVFTPDGKSILFVSDSGGQCDLWKADRADPARFWWQNSRFPLTRLTDDPEVERDLRVSPAGTDVAFVRGLGDLWLIGADGKNPRRLLEPWTRPEFDWSPDGKWLVYARADDQFNRDVWIWPIDGSRQPLNLSRHPDNDGNPVWSPDGKAIAFTGSRFGTEVDIFLVYLAKAEDETTARDRKLREAVEKIQRVRSKPASPPAGAAPAAGAPAAAKTEPEKSDPKNESPQAGGNDQNKGHVATAAPEKKLPEVKIDFDGLGDRIRRVSIGDATEQRLFWSHDSKRLAFAARVNGQEGTYTISPPDDLAPKLLVAKTGYHARWIAQANQVLWRVDDL
ncbi:MAG: DPP IV N-terminal domain-containing protein, partial [Thermoguttaceae bacterium]